MLTVVEKQKNIDYQTRKSSYGIVQNELGQIAVVYHDNWGLIFLGGKVEENEKSDETIKREALEEIGYEVDDLKYYDTIEAYYEVWFRGMGLINSHNIADFYTGTIKSKVQEQIEPDTSLRWYYPNELFGKMKLEFQNVMLEKLYKNNKNN